LRYPHNLVIAGFSAGQNLGTVGLAWTHDRRTGEHTGSVEGTVEENCDSISDWGAAAVLSLTEFGIEHVTLPANDFARGLNQRRIAWCNLPIRDRHVPNQAFEEGWVSVSAELRRLLRWGARVVVHGEGNFERSAMIIARLLVELGNDAIDAFRMIHEFKPGLFSMREMISYVYEQQEVKDRSSSREPLDIRDRAVGALLGLAVGDALGTTLEFKSRDTYPWLTDMIGGGPFRLRPGEWTDDTAMALALADTLRSHDDYDDWEYRDELLETCHTKYAMGKQNRLARERIRRRIRKIEGSDYEGNPRRFERALMQRFVAWMERGEYSCNGRCFDIGMTVRGALRRFKQTGDPMAGSKAPDSAGNGSLMRLAPVAIRYWNDRRRLRDYAARQSRTTHGAEEAVDACVAYAELLADAIEGIAPPKVLAPRQTNHCRAIRGIMAGSWQAKGIAQIGSSGYVVHSLEAALWSVGRSPTFEEAVLTAANLGEDADTTAAIAGQLAGALHGASGIPAHWLEKLAWRDRIVRYAEALLPEEIRKAGKAGERDLTVGRSGRAKLG
jgi:ADP-ribosyl-[dinitrogen reductase] hydrolase